MQIIIVYSLVNFRKLEYTHVTSTWIKIELCQVSRDCLQAPFKFFINFQKIFILN